MLQEALLLLVACGALGLDEVDENAADAYNPSWRGGYPLFEIEVRTRAGEAQ